MFKRLCRFLFKIKGWHLKSEAIQPYKKCVIIAAPHTSNWDVVFMIASFDKMGLPLRFTLKKEWMKFPYAFFLRQVGAIGIDRSPKDSSQNRPSMVDLMAALFETYDELVLGVSVEGTRKLVKKWKTGFYYIAQKANVPILLGYLDYQKKEAGIGKVIVPSGDFEKDMQEIMAFYAQIAPKYPEYFSLDYDFVPQNSP